MPGEKFRIRTLGAVTLIVAAIGSGIFLGAPEVAVAQEGTTTTVVEDNTTDTTVGESTDESGKTDRTWRGDHDCGDRSDETSSENSS